MFNLTVNHNKSSITRSLHLTIILLALTLTSEAMAKPVVAVLEINDLSGVLSPDNRAVFADYLNAQLATSGKFRTIGQGKVRTALREKVAESYEACFDQACQIELGRELAAEKAVSTRIIKTGRVCIVTATLFDLKRAVSENAAIDRTKCTKADLLNSVGIIVPQLAGLARPSSIRSKSSKKSIGEHVWSDWVLALLLLIASFACVLWEKRDGDDYTSAILVGAFVGAIITFLVVRTGATWAAGCRWGFATAAFLSVLIDNALPIIYSDYDFPNARKIAIAVLIIGGVMPALGIIYALGS